MESTNLTFRVGGFIAICLRFGRIIIEAGRAGRDGQKAYAVLLSNEQDFDKYLSEQHCLSTD